MEHLLTFAITMFTVTNPVGAIAIFAGLTAGKTVQEKTLLARKTALAVMVVLLIVTWTGSLLLKGLGVTPEGLEVAGGVIIALMGLAMLKSEHKQINHNQDEHDEAMDKEDISIVPMTIPIIAGPGAMTTIILATQQFPSVSAQMGISAIAMGITMIIWIGLHFAAPISNKLGVNGMNVVSKIMGIVLTAIAFQMLAAGLQKLLPGLA